MRKTLILLFLLIPFTSFASGPVKNGQNWNYVNASGEVVKDSFVVIDGESYYFDPYGNLSVNRLIEKEGNRYYADENGRMMKNRWKKAEEPGGKSYWYYFTDTGKALKSGWLEIGTDCWHFTGFHMDTGWYGEADGQKTDWYYLGTEDDGVRKEGWMTWKDTTDSIHPAGWYYLRPGTGIMLSNTEETVEGHVYAFNGDGTLACGPVTVTDDRTGKSVVRYYDPESGRRAEGWLYLGPEEETYGDGWYFFVQGLPFTKEKWERSLTERVGTVKIDGYTYAFDENGKMVTGPVTSIEGKCFVFNSDGRLDTTYVNR